MRHYSTNTHVQSNKTEASLVVHKLQEDRHSCRHNNNNMNDQIHIKTRKDYCK